MPLFLSPQGTLSPAGILLLFGFPLLLLEYHHRHFNGLLFYVGFALSAAILITTIAFNVLGGGDDDNSNLLVKKNEPASSVVRKLSENLNSRDYCIQCIHYLYASLRTTPSNLKILHQLHFPSLIPKILAIHDKDDLVGNVCFTAVTNLLTVEKKRKEDSSKSPDDEPLSSQSTNEICTDVSVYIKFMSNSLEREKCRENENDECAISAAELQRKGCLLVGSLADISPKFQNDLVKSNAIQSVLDAARFFRLDVPVTQWAMMALFSICYDNPSGKLVLLEEGGFEVIVSAVNQHLNESLHVVRQSVATLFDVLRITNEIDFNKVRMAAFNAGLIEMLEAVRDSDHGKDSSISQMVTIILENCRPTAIPAVDGVMRQRKK